MRRERFSYNDYPPYVSVAERRKLAEKEVAKRKKRGETIEAVVLEGKTIARTFWGKAWCDHLEEHCDYESRLPRGRTYIRNGSVVHLAIGEGRVDALVQGTSTYEVKVEIVALDKARWKRVVSECAGEIDSLVELLRGKVSSGVMRIVTHPEQGLFPLEKQITMTCSCPDDAYMCKHVAAALYGVGARLDASPELLFRLRRVDPTDLVAKGVTRARPAAKASQGTKVLSEKKLADVFGIEIDEEDAPTVTKKSPKKVAKKR